jgi:DNA anti-recombination protein RmuC
LEVEMVQNLDEVMAKIKAIKEEMDVVEYRVINTRTHVENIESDVKKIGKEVLEGFHSVSAKINKLEEIIKKLEKEVDEMYNSRK